MNSLSRESLNGKARSIENSLNLKEDESPYQMVEWTRRGFDPKKGAPGGDYYLSPLSEYENDRLISPNYNPREQPWVGPEPYLAPLDMNTQRASSPGDPGYRNRIGLAPADEINWGGRMDFRRNPHYKISRSVESHAPPLALVNDWQEDIDPVPSAEPGQEYVGPYEHAGRGQVVPAEGYGMGGLGMLGAGESMTEEQWAAKQAADAALTPAEKSDPSIVKSAFDLALSLYQQRQELKIAEEARKRAEAEAAARGLPAPTFVPSGMVGTPSKGITGHWLFWPGLTALGLFAGYQVFKRMG